MSDYPEIPGIQEPQVPERRYVEIYPGQPPEVKPVPLEGLPFRVDEIPEELLQEPKTRGAGAGAGAGAGGGAAGAGAGAGDLPGLPKKGNPSGANIPSVDEISSYWSFRNPSRWGITVSKSGLYQYAYAIQKVDLSIHRAQAIATAHTFIVYHQVHHFLMDRAVSSLESVLSISGNTQNSFGYWEKFHQKFRGSREPYSPLEESLSCAYARRQLKLKKTESAQGFATLLERQPAGYQSMSADGLKIQTCAGLISHQQAASELLSEYIRVRPGRALGLHGLMLYENHLNGTNGDRFFSIGGNKVELSVYYVP